MKKTLIPSLPVWLPEEIRAIGRGDEINSKK